MDKHPVSMLNELAQKHNIPFATFEYTSIGPPHACRFTAVCTFQEQKATGGNQCLTHQTARTSAASAMLRLLGIIPPLVHQSTASPPAVLDTLSVPVTDRGSVLPDGCNRDPIGSPVLDTLSVPVTDRGSPASGIIFDKAVDDLRDMVGCPGVGTSPTNMATLTVYLDIENRPKDLDVLLPDIKKGLQVIVVCAERWPAYENSRRQYNQFENIVFRTVKSGVADAADVLLLTLVTKMAVEKPTQSQVIIGADRIYHAYMDTVKTVFPSHSITHYERATGWLETAN